MLWFTPRAILQIEMDLNEMDDQVRDGFLSNLSTAVTNAIQAIRERLPEMPEFLRPFTQSSLPFAANLAEDEDWIYQNRLMLLTITITITVRITHSFAQWVVCLLTFILKYKICLFLQVLEHTYDIFNKI